MRHKFLSLLCTFVAAPAFANDVSGLPEGWADLHYGACYPSVKSGMSDIYGPNYASDENIAQQNKKFGQAEMIASADHTSGTNAPRTVFEKRGRHHWCVVLASPPVASLIPAVAEIIAFRPLQWSTLTQAAAGYPETKVIYIWSKPKAIYAPVHCYLIFNQAEREIGCEDAYK
jgi:hypothetical protein